MAEKITKVSKEALALIKKFEGFCAQPYLCPANVPTIGYGATFYEDGTKVKVTDPAISEERATQLLQNVLKTFEKFKLFISVIEQLLRRNKQCFFIEKRQNQQLLLLQNLLNL